MVVIHKLSFNDSHTAALSIRLHVVLLLIGNSIRTSYPYLKCSEKALKLASFFSPCNAGKAQIVKNYINVT